MTVRYAECNLWSSVIPRLYIGVNGLILEATRAEINEFEAYIEVDVPDLLNSLSRIFSGFKSQCIILWFLRN